MDGAPAPRRPGPGRRGEPACASAALVEPYLGEGGGEGGGEGAGEGVGGGEVGVRVGRVSTRRVGTESMRRARRLRGTHARASSGSAGREG